jgi:hypothetical protein
LKGSIDLCLTYKKTGKSVIGYVDSDWGNNEDDRKSYTGFAFIMSGGAIAWESRKQKTVALSSTEAEYMALSEGCKEAIFLQGLLEELFDVKESVILCNDNQGAERLTVNPMVNRRSKHIDIRHHFIRDKVGTGDICVKYVPTDDMVADILTKGLHGPKFTKFVSGLGLKSPT